MNVLIQIFTAFIGSLGFGILFNIKKMRLLFAALGGMISWSLFLVLGFLVVDEVIRYFIVSAVISVYCEIMARIFKTPKTTFLMTSFIPLIPGSGLYHTMTNAFLGDYSGFLSRGLSTLSLSVALALGVIIITVFFKIINNNYSHKIQIEIVSGKQE